METEWRAASGKVWILERGRNKRTDKEGNRPVRIQHILREELLVPKNSGISSARNLGSKCTWKSGHNSLKITAEPAEKH